MQFERDADTAAQRPCDETGAWPCAWLSIDDRGTMLRVNATLERWLGVPAAELVGRPFDKLLTSPSRVLYQSYLQPLLRLHGHVQELALMLRSSDGTPLEVLLYSTRAGLSSAAPVELVLAPIRRRRRIEDELLRIKHAADHAPGLIFQLRSSPEGRLHFPYLSEAVRRLYGITPDQAQDDGSVLLDRIEAGDRGLLLQALEESAAQGSDWHGCFRVRSGGRDDGAGATAVVHEMHVTGRTLADGARLWHGHIADVSERVRLEAELAQQHTAAQVQQARSTMLARISHELRTPLNGILGFIELVLGDPESAVTPLQRSRLDIAHASGRHLLHLVNQVLDLSKAEALTAHTLEPLPLATAVARALQIVQPQAQAFGVTLLPPDCDEALWVQAHEPNLHQVLMNLLSNAVKYNRSGGFVTVCAERRSGGVACSISDTGSGLSQAQQAELFQPFNRLGAQHGDRPGTGLGLVITRQLLQQMGGRIEVESELGQGACFTIWLPAATPAGRSKRLTAPPDTSDMAPRLQAASGRVLYVEDNPVNAMLMEAMTALRPGIELRLAADAATALTITKDWLPDLMLLDMHLPDMEGTELLGALRRNPRLRAVPAIVVSAAAEPADQQLACALGFAGYWVKPLDVAATLAELDRLLGWP